MPKSLQISNGVNPEPELFKNFSKQKQRRWVLFKGQKSPFHPGRISLSISYENLALCGIGVVMTLVLVFALGVERGRRGPRLNAKPVKVELRQEEALPAAVSKPQAQETITPVSKSYTVQIVAYNSNRLAQQAREEIGKKNYSTFIIISGNKYQVCVGRYSSRREAEKSLQNIKKVFKGAFVREVK